MLVEHIPCMVKTDRVYCRIFIVIMVAQKVIGIPYFHQIWLVKMIDIAVITHFGPIGFLFMQNLKKCSCALQTSIGKLLANCW